MALVRKALVELLMAIGVWVTALKYCITELRTKEDRVSLEQCLGTILFAQNMNKAWKYLIEGLVAFD